MKQKSTLFCIGLAMSAALGSGCGQPVAPVAPVWLDARIKELAVESAPGAEAAAPHYKGVANSSGGRTDWKVQLDAGKCYWFSGHGDFGVDKLTLYLWDPKDSQVAHEKPNGRKVVMTYCAESTGMYRLQAKVVGGAGHYGVGIYAKAAPPKEAPAAQTGLVKVIEREAAAAAPGAVRVGEYFTGNADKTDWYTALDAGTCYWFIGAGGPGVKQLFLYLWDPNGSRINVSRSISEKVNVGHCATVSGMHHFQAKIDSGSGDYMVGVFAKKAAPGKSASR
jgi:hypothetical protein